MTLTRKNFVASERATCPIRSRSCVWRIAAVRGKLTAFALCWGACCVHEKICRRAGADLHVGGSRYYRERTRGVRRGGSDRTGKGGSDETRFARQCGADA